MSAVDQHALSTLFLEARTHNGFLPEPVSDELLRRVWEVARMGPTASNSGPLRVAFVRTPEGKERLRPALAAGNVDKTMAAPVTAIFAYDLAFYEKFPKLFPPNPKLREVFAQKPEMAEAVARQSGTLGAAYFMLAARALGLACGPMAGFDNGKVDAEFFAGTSWRSNFLCNLGYGDPSKVYPRNPRLDFEEACTLL